MSPRPKVDPRQRGGLALATPRRVRFTVPANEWDAVHERDRATVRAPWAVPVSWFPLYADGAHAPHAWLSSPVESRLAHRVAAALSGVGLEVATREAPCWAHVVRVRYPDGGAVAFGLSVPARDLAHAEADGYPIASVDDGGRVRPWMGCAHGHTDAEVLAAHEFVRGRTIAADAAAGAGR